MAMIHEGDIGVVFTGTVKDGGSVVDLSNFETVEMIFNPPNGAASTKTASAPTPTNGKVVYTTVSGDINVPGRWAVQVKVTNASGDSSPQTFYSEKFFFDVGSKLA